MKRRLRVIFDRSVSNTTRRAEELEITVTPLNSANHAERDATYAALRQTKKVRLTLEKNVVEFELQPTFDPGLDRPIYYRLAWRRGFLGRVEQHDFTMPDRDIDWDDLKDLGNIITGENYLKEEDLGVPGRVARLDNNGDVLDGNGLPLSGVDLAPLHSAIAQEARDRQSADADVDRRLTLRLNTQLGSITNTLDSRFSQEAASRLSGLTAERTARTQEVASLRTSLESQINATGNGLGTLRVRVDGHDAALARKADLVDGKIPTSQIPALALNTAVQVEDETQMLALTSQQVQRGDIAVRPDGNWILTGDAITDINSWVKLSGGIGGGVESVNGQVGSVVLSAADIGARPASQSIPQADVTGLVSALGSKATTTALSTLSGQLTTTNTNLTNLTSRVGTVEGVHASLLADYTANAVKKNSQGEVPSAVLGADIVRVDAEGTLRRKDGTVIAVSGGGSGGGAVSSVNNKVGAVMLTATDVGARPLNAEVPIAEVQGLPAALDAKATVTALQSTNTRVGRAEVEITDIKSRLDSGEAPGTGGGTGGTRTTVSWTADDETNPSLVTMRSPFGIDASGEPYYDPDGAMEGEGAYPYVSMYGNLVLRKLDPNAPPEPEWGTKAQIDAVDARVATLEQGGTGGGGGYEPPIGGIPATDLEQPLQDAYAKLLAATSSADPSTLVLRSDLGTFSAGTPTADSHVTTRKYVDDQIATRATATSVASLTTTVNGKAAQADLSALATRVGQAESTLSVKADLDGSSLIPVTQIPALPGTKVTGWNTKADLDAPGGRIPVGQLPTAIPQANVQNLTTVLGTKADLVGGKIPNSQLPPLAIGDTYPVANRAAMLALSTAQAQRGDIAVITDTNDKGTYRLAADDPSVFANWVKLTVGGTGSVDSVNGQTGIVTLSAADVQARPAGAAIPQADVTGLAASLSAKADTTYVDTQVATRATPAQVTAQVSAQSVSKLSVEFVSTTPIASRSGSQTIDGSLVGAGRRVLLTGQSASADNGIWVTASGAWTRAPEMADGSTFMPATLVAATGGATHADSLWQIISANPGTVGTNANNWTKILRGGVPKTYTAAAASGLTIEGTAISAKAGPGIIVDSQGIRIDTAVQLRKMAVDVPGGAATVTIPHTFGTADVMTQVREVSSGNTVLLGITTTTTNIILEFATAPAVGQYRLTAIA